MRVFFEILSFFFSKSLYRGGRRGRTRTMTANRHTTRRERQRDDTDEDDTDENDNETRTTQFSAPHAVSAPSTPDERHPDIDFRQLLLRESWRGFAEAREKAPRH